MLTSAAIPGLLFLKIPKSNYLFWENYTIFTLIVPENYQFPRNSWKCQGVGGLGDKQLFCTIIKSVTNKPGPFKIYSHLDKNYGISLCTHLQVHEALHVISIASILIVYLITFTNSHENYPRQDYEFGKSIAEERRAVGDMDYPGI